MGRRARCRCWVSGVCAALWMGRLGIVHRGCLAAQSMGPDAVKWGSPGQIQSCCLLVSWVYKLFLGWWVLWVYKGGTMGMEPCSHETTRGHCARCHWSRMDQGWWHRFLVHPWAPVLDGCCCWCCCCRRGSGTAGVFPAASALVEWACPCCAAWFWRALG
jgi:hypothetical protein